MGTQRRFWTSEDDALLRRLYPDTPTLEVARRLGRTVASTYNRADKLGLAKSPVYLASPAACRLRRGVNPGIAYRFPKGHVPHNKGKAYPVAATHPNCRRTQFTKGVRRGVAVRLYKPVGTERVSKDGYLERKVNDGLPLNRRWRAVHLVTWEAANGPLPKGHAIAFKNGDKRDIRLDNLECITRAELMARNTVHRLPKPLALTVQLIGALRRKINRKGNNEPQHRRLA